MKKPQYLFEESEDPNFCKKQRLKTPEGFIEHIDIPFVKLDDGRYLDSKELSGDKLYARIHHDGERYRIGVHAPSGTQSVTHGKFHVEHGPNQRLEDALVERAIDTDGFFSESKPGKKKDAPLEHLLTSAAGPRGSGCRDELMNTGLLAATIYAWQKIFTTYDFPAGQVPSKEIMLYLAVSAIPGIIAFYRAHKNKQPKRSTDFNTVAHYISEAEQRLEEISAEEERIDISANAGPELSQRIEKKNSLVEEKRHLLTILEESTESLRSFATKPVNPGEYAFAGEARTYDEAYDRLLKLVGLEPTGSNVDITVTLGAQTSEEFRNKVADIRCFYDHAPLADDATLPVVGITDANGKLTGEFAHAECNHGDQTRPSLPLGSDFTQFQNRCEAAYQTLGEERNPQQFYINLKDIATAPATPAFAEDTPSEDTAEEDEPTPKKRKRRRKERAD